MKIGIGVSGSYCSMHYLFEVLELLKNHDLYIIISDHLLKDTKFYTKEELERKLLSYTKHPIVDTINESEKFASNVLDVMLVMPCTATTLSKIYYAIYDNSLLMAVKATLRNNKPIVISLYTNDGLSKSAKHLFSLYNSKNFYIAPIYQDDYIHKPNSIASDYTKVLPTIELALKNIQYQPVINHEA